MRRTDEAHAATAGFTLIEVLVAMVILAVGLLQLEAMAIGTSRLVNKARVQSQFTFLAADTLERTLGKIREEPAIPPVGTTTYLASHDSRRDTVRVVVSSVPANGSFLYTVRVAVVPPAGGGAVARRDSVSLSGQVFR